ncbi:MAG: hypothetical protein ABIS27_14345 [Longimicrobiales bacterium]
MDAARIEQARTRLESIGGVARVLIDPASGDIALVCMQPIQRPHVEEEARAILEELLGDGASHTIEVTYRAEHRERARVRFAELRRHVGSGNVRIDVDLDWGDESFHGTATGDVGGAVELRTAAQAALVALAAIVTELDLRLAGVKQVKSFDAELIVVSLYAAEDPARKFIGAVVAAADPHRSAVLAVLSALNRVLGNYLNRP